VTRVTEFPGRRTRRTGLRAAALAGLAAAAAAALGACSVGQITQTAYQETPVPGVNHTFSVVAPDDKPGGSVSVRDMLIPFDGPDGYKAGATAPLQVSIFNDTTAALKVTITAPGVAQAVTFRTGSPTAESAAPSESPTGASASASASASAPPSTPASAPASPSVQPSEPAKPAAGPATLTIPSREFVVLSLRTGKYLALQGLANALKPGYSVSGITFQFQLDGGLQVQSTPASPAPGASPVTQSCYFSGPVAICRAPLGPPTELAKRAVPTEGTTHD
jgi:hypothetical protein